MITIGVDAARLAGLQIDALTKFRAGQLSLDHMERFLNLTPEAREERFGDGKRPKTKPEKFELFKDLGVIEIPADYDHTKRLSTFYKKHQDAGKKSFYYYNEMTTDQNFSNPSRILKPGDKLWVRAFRQATSGMTTSEERLKFLKSQNAVFTGAQGASVVFDQKRNQLPKGYWYVSFDEKERLWQDPNGHHRVPCVNANSSGAFNFYLGYFENGWGPGGILLCFCDLPAGEA